MQGCPQRGSWPIAIAPYPGAESAEPTSSLSMRTLFQRACPLRAGIFFPPVSVIPAPCAALSTDIRFRRCGAPHIGSGTADPVDRTSESPRFRTGAFCCPETVGAGSAFVHRVRAQSRSLSSGQVVMMRSAGTPLASARWAPYWRKSSCPGACASLSMLKRQPASSAS